MRIIAELELQLHIPTEWLRKPVDDRGKGGVDVVVGAVDLPLLSTTADKKGLDRTVNGTAQIQAISRNFNWFQKASGSDQKR